MKAEKCETGCSLLNQPVQRFLIEHSKTLPRSRKASGGSNQLLDPPAKTVAYREWMQQEWRLRETAKNRKSVLFVGFTS